MSRRKNRRQGEAAFSHVEPSQGWDAWRSQPVTEKQLNYVRYLAHRASTPLPRLRNRGQAADEIQRLHALLGIKSKPFNRPAPRKRTDTGPRGLLMACSGCQPWRNDHRHEESCSR